MSLFQQSVIKKYLQESDNNSVNPVFDKFYKHFGNTERQDNIRELKEEQYQEGFLRELFVDVLGYTINPEPNYNLLTEQKNEKDSKKADGAILQHGTDASRVIAVIELKGADTTDLAKVETHAFGYKNNQNDCKYVITSNFEKLRFYIDNAIDFEEFDLFNLTRDRFNLFYLCLAKDNLLNGIPQKIKEASVSQEENITKKLYSDYSAFKRYLFQNICSLNPRYDKLTLFKNSQKLLDRFLFIFFAEDRLLLPPNSIREIIKQWEQLKDLDNYTPLYDRFKKYFGYMNTGYKGRQYEIFAYDGSLFAANEILDNLKIDDQLLYEHTQKLSNYDYDTEVDVNILGHIFEHSLNEIEEIQAELEGKELDKSKTKRKKDGVFYTPKYITKYIVENTVGALCTEKKKELEINEEEIVISKRKDKKKELLEKIDTYRNWLLKLTICDPACGSGAFLNQALDYLLTEHKKLDELKARITNSPMIISDIENSVLENNIFGVDLNEEAVEIAKLSLWLKTAQKGRKLSDLSNNIKCGNSLIDDPEVAGEKAFDWYLEFPQVFPFYRGKNKQAGDAIKKKIIQSGVLNYPDQGDIHHTDEVSEPAYSYKSGSKGFEKYGFDVVIGNPPYGAKITKTELNYLIEHQKVFGLSNLLTDTYFSFYILSLTKLLTKNGLLGFITPNTWRLIESADNFRKFIVSLKVVQLIQHKEKVFNDATVDCDTVIINNSKFENNDILIQIQDYPISNFEHKLSQSLLTNQKFFNLALTEKSYKLIEKIQKKSVFVKDHFVIKNGVKPYEKGKGKPPQTEETLKTYPFTAEIKPDDTFSPLIGGRSFHRYKLLWKNDYWIKYGEWLAAPRDKEIFDAPEKLIFRQTSDSIIGTFITDGYIMRNNTHIVLSVEIPKYHLKFILGVLNSKFSSFYYWCINPETGEALAEVKAFHLGLLPFPDLTEEKQVSIINLVDQILLNNSTFQAIHNKFISVLKSNFTLKISQTINEFYLFDFKIFINELKKQKINLSLNQQSEWIEFFNENQKKLSELSKQTNTFIKEIDLMVYELYGLTEEEIKIVEGA